MNTFLRYIKLLFSFECYVQKTGVNVLTKHLTFFFLWHHFSCLKVGSCLYKMDLSWDMTFRTSAVLSQMTVNWYYCMVDGCHYLSVRNIRLLLREMLATIEYHGFTFGYNVGVTLNMSLMWWKSWNSALSPTYLRVRHTLTSPLLTGLSPAISNARHHWHKQNNQQKPQVSHS